MFWLEWCTLNSTVDAFNVKQVCLFIFLVDNDEDDYNDDDDDDDDDNDDDDDSGDRY